MRERFLSGPQDNGVEALERFRLNQVESFYRGTSFGALRLSALAEIYRTPDTPETPPERKRVNEEMRKEYMSIVADLMAYEQMQSFGTTWEAMSALGGQFTGSLGGPESWLGWRAGGATLLSSTLRAAGQQAAISAAVDPLIQGLNINAGVQDEYEFGQTLLSGAMGGTIGAGFHLGGAAASSAFGKVMSQVDRRVALARMAQDYPDFYNPWLERELAGAAEWQQRGSFERPPPPDEPPPPGDPTPPAASGVPDSAFNGDLREQLDRVFATGDSVPLANVGFRPDEVAALQEAGLADASGSMSRDQWALYEEEVSRRLAERRERYGTAAPTDTGPRRFDTDPYGPGPGHSFDDAVKTAKDEIEARSGAARMKGGKLKEAAQLEAFNREVGEDLQRVLDREGLRPQDVDDLWRYYDRQPGEHPYYALERAFDNRADALTKEQIGSLEDSLEWQRDLAEFDRALASEYYPGNARSEYWQEAPQLRNTGAHFGGFATRVPGQTFDASGWLTYLHDMGLAEYEIPFSTGPARDGGGAPAGGPAQPEGPRGAAQGGAGATVGGVGGGEGRAAPAGGGGAGGTVGGPTAPAGEPFRGDVTPGRMAAAREAMPEDVRAEFDMLVAMGAAKKAASEKDERAFLALLDKYAPAQREVDGGRATGTEVPSRATGQDQAAPAQGGGTPAPKLTRDGRFIDTRGRGVQYHGTGNANLELDSSHYSSLNYYGMGFYSTDAVDVGRGYAGARRNRGGEPTLYRVEEKHPLKILDGEAPLPPEVLKVLEPIGDTNGNPILELLKGAEGETPPRNLRELYDRIRDEGTEGGYSADTIQEVFDSINQALQDLGYHGMSHEGGLRTKADPHRVVIYFDPERDISLVKESFDKYAPGGKEAERGAEVLNDLGPPKETFKEQIERLKREREPAQRLVDDALAQKAPSLVLEHPDGRKLMLSRGFDESPFRITSFDKDGPVGHRDYDGSPDKGIYGRDGMVQEVNTALREGFTVRTRPAREGADVRPEVKQGPAEPGLSDKADGLPPPAPGMRRMYHGGESATAGEARWMTPHYAYARDYGSGNRTVWYVDVPENAPWLVDSVDVSGTNMPRVIGNSEAPAEVMAQAKKVPARQEPGRIEERPLLDTPEASPEDLARRQRAREKEEAEARMRGRQTSGKAQESAEDTPLFGGERQKDIFGLQGGTGERPDLQALAQRRSGGALFNEQERPDVGIPAGLSPERQAAVMSLQQQTTALARDFNVPVRQGRVEMRGALGTYNNRSGVIRVQEYPDFEVVTHEIGHSLEAMVGRELTDLTQQFGYELARLDYDQDPTTGMRVNEGFAEYIRYFIGRRNDPNIPEGAMNWAPTFTTEFLTLMERERPDLLAALNRAGAAYYAYNQATSIDAVGSVRRVRHESQTFGERMAEAFYDLPNTIRTVFIKGYEILFDSNNDMARFVREMGRLIRENEGGGPVRLEDAYNPDVLLRLFPRSQQAAVGDMIRGVMRYHSLGRGGVSLSEAMSYALNDDRSGWGQWDREMHANFSTYLIAKNAEYLWRRFNAGELPNPPVAFNHGDAMQAMTDLETQFPRFRLASEMVHQYSRDLLGKLYDAGIMSADLHNTLTGREFYVPFMRDLSDKPMTNAPHAASIGGPGATEVIKRLRGSARDIFDPIESLMMQTFLVERVVQHNDIVRSMVRMSERAGAPGGRWVEVVPANEMRGTTFNLGEAIRRKAREIGMADDEAEAFVTMMADLSGEDPLLGRFWQMERTEGRGEPIVFYREGGELRAVRVSSNRREGELGLAELLTQAPPAVTDVFHNMAALSANVMRSGITSAPAYLIANFARDQMAAFLLRSDYVPFVGGIRGAVDELRQSQNALLYGYMGGVAGGASVGPVERAVEANVNALRARNYAVTRFGDRTPAGVAKGLLELTSITEAGTRNSIFSTVFDAAQRRGLSEWEAAVEAAYQAQDILDFSRHGSRTMALRNWVPFMNAHLQGLDKARRTIIDPIVRQMREGAVFERDTAAFNNALASLVKVAGVGVGLGAVYAALNWEKDTYRNASSYLKGTHIVVPMGGKEVAIVPKPFELSLGFTLGEYAYAWLAQNDERAAEQFGEAAWQVLLPPVPWTGMPLMTIPLELKTGVSLFTGREIVPSKLRNLPSEMQYDDRTSEIAKYLGAQLGMSPAKIDFAIGAQFGTMGRDFMALSSGINPDTPAKSWYDVAIIRRFIKDPTRSSDATTRFWDFMARETGKYNRNVNGYDQLMKEFRDDEARTLLSKLPASEKAFVTLKSAADEDGKPAFTADDRRLHPLQRAYDAVTTLNGLRQELSANRFAPYETGARVRLSPETRRDLLENIRELGQIEMANALNMVETPGFKGLPILDPNDAMAKIRALSPEVAAEVATRYATAKIYKTPAVIQAWPQVRDKVVRQGSRADLADQRDKVLGEGFEFDGDRVRKPQKRRAFIAPTP